MNRNVIRGFVFASATALATIGWAQQEQTQEAQQKQQAQQEQQQSQQQQPGGEQQAALQGYEEGASVILSGTIESIEGEGFILDYGEDKVSVNLEDWEWADQIGQRLSEGQQVTVSGTVDKGLFERREIEADNIYVTTDFTYYYIVDENPAYAAQQRQREAEQEGTFLSTRGEVVEVSDKTITVQSDGNTIKVDTSELAYDPLDETGVQQIKKGDRIYVFGDIDDNFFENRTMSAESLITLAAARDQADMQRAEPAIERPGPGEVDGSEEGQQ
ncbi:NirD/YgiW/YdeI family stress tolerance protein [Proteobacteria bacterium 005FR1]|nr:NirD/YgiW/YdeI family stress tolerance protein [Proteobacteria bacterium 005FR1]